MAKKDKKASKFRGAFKGKVKDEAHESNNRERNYGYLKLPKNVKVWAPEPGAKNLMFDIIPYIVTDPKHPLRNDESGRAVVDSLWYRRPFFVHKNVGVDKDTVVCLRSFGKKCPICEYANKIHKEGAEKEETSELWGKARSLYVVIPKGQKDFEEAPHVFDMSDYLFQNKLSEELDENEEYEQFPDLYEGLTLKTRWSKEQFKKNEFAKISRIDFEEREEQYDDDILEKVPNLDKLLKELSYDEIQAKFFATEAEPDEDDEDEDEDEKPSKKSSKKSEPAKGKKKPEPEDDEDEDEDEEEKPVKGKKPAAPPAKSKKKPEPEEDDEDEDEDEPKRKSKSAVPPAKSKKKPEPEPDEDEDEEEDEESLEDQIKAAGDVDELTDIYMDNSEFKAHVKNLKKITKKSKLRDAMLEILDVSEDDDDDEEEDDLPFNKGGKGSPANKKTAKKPEPEDEDEDDDDEDEDEAPVRGKKPAPVTSKSNGKKDGEKCPHNYQYGIDTEDYDACDSCKLWEQCIEAKEKNAKKKK